MANELTPIGKSRPPSKLLARTGRSTTASNFTEGVADSFPRLSIRGKAFWIKMNGKEIRAGAVDPNKGAVLDVVLVNSGKLMSKAYYAKAFGTGDAEMPDCWSLDAIRPDQSITHPVNPTCGDCPKNAFNSAPSGRGGKACQDSKRVVVTTADQLLREDPILLMMRVPQQSHKNMKNYIEMAARHGYTEPFSCVTRMSFDQNVEFPKVEFEFVEPLTDDEFEAAEVLAQSKKVNDMLKNPDFDNAAGDTNAVHANDDASTRLQHKARQPQQGFGDAGGAAPTEAPAAQQAAPVSRETPEVWEDLGDGTELNLETGEVRQQEKPTAELELDPDVLQTQDGRFFHRAQKKFVDSPYRDASLTPGVRPAAQPARENKAKEAAPEAEAEVEKPKRKRRSRAEIEAAAAAAAAPPEEKKVEEPQASNGSNGSAPTPRVVAASPKLEALLGDLASDEK